MHYRAPYADDYWKWVAEKVSKVFDCIMRERDSSLRKALTKDIYPKGIRVWHKDGDKERLYINGEPTAYVRFKHPLK